jgi:hypothetical protein
MLLKLKTRRGSAPREHGRGIVPHAPFFSHNAVSEHGVTRTGRRDNNAFQPWVKPEVDPPNAQMARQRLS